MRTAIKIAVAAIVFCLVFSLGALALDIPINFNIPLAVVAVCIFFLGGAFVASGPNRQSPEQSRQPESSPE